MPEQNTNRALTEAAADEWKVLPSGLTVLVRPMPGYSGTHVIYATRFGSIDRDFRVPPSRLPQDSRQQTGSSGLARRAGHTDELHLLDIRRQGSAQLLRRGKALGQRREIFVCLFDGHCVNPRFDVCRAASTSCTGPDRTGPPEYRPSRPKNPARRR